MNQQTDSQLLRAYAEDRSEAAFSELVRRHVDFTYSAAMRMVRDTHLAEDVTQGVFVALANSSPQLLEHPLLSGWLHRTAQNIAAQTVRTIERRRVREQEAAAMNELLSAESDASWEAIAPHLDAALGELNESDRDALLLRYFEKRSAQEMAGILGISDEAAQKRVSRAVQRLREYFSKRNVTIGASGLAVLISANAVQSAPAGLAIAISAAVFLAGTSISTSTAIAVTKTIVMTTLQKALVTAAVAALAGGGIYETRQAAQLRRQNQAVQQQEASLVEQNRQLQRERDEATNQLFSLAGQTSQTSDNIELLRLRGEVGVLRQQLTAQRRVEQPKAGDGVDSASLGVAGQLVTAIEQGDSTALGKLSEYAKAQFDSYKANSVGLTGDELAAAWSKSLGGIASAFDSLADAAIKGNTNARQAIDQALRISSLQPWDIPSLGKLAGAGDEHALEILLNPSEYGVLLASTVSALQPAADSGNPKAIAALVAILGDEKEKPLWFLASQGLQKAAGSGNAVAIAALKSISPPQ